MTQDAFDFHGKANVDTRSRRKDPATSTAAGKQMAGKLTEIQDRVLWVVGYRELTQHDIIVSYRLQYGADTPESTIRTRVSELVALGKLRTTGRTIPVGNGKSRAMTYRTTGE